MKAFLSVLLLLSLSVNVGFLTGCSTFHDPVYGNPCRVSGTNASASAQRGDDGLPHLVRIAGLLGIPTAGKSPSDLAGDICYALDRSTPVPAAMDDRAFEEMASALGSSQEAAMRKYHRFVKELQDKRVIAVAPENRP